MTFVGHLGVPGGQWVTFLGHLGVPGGQWVTSLGHLEGRWGTMGDFCRSLWGCLEDSG